MSSKKILIAFTFQVLANAGGICSNSNKHRETLQSVSNVANNNMLTNDMQKSVGNFLEPENEQKMRRTSKQWRNVKIYKNISPNEREMAVFMHVDTGEIHWEAAEYKKQWIWETSTIPNKKKLVSLLRQNDVAKWNGVLMWIMYDNIDNWEYVKNCHLQNSKKESQNDLFVKKLMLTAIENVDLKIITFHTPIMFAAAAEMGDADSILALIKRGADVHQQSEALHMALEYGNLHVCRTLLDNNADINATSFDGLTPLERAAYWGHDSVLELLLERGANRDRIGSALKIANKIPESHWNRDNCVKILEQWQN